MSDAPQEKHEPSEEELAQALSQARKRFASEGLGELGSFQKDLTPITPQALEAFEGIQLAAQPLSEEAFRQRIAEEDAQLMSAWEEDRRRARMAKLISHSELPAMFEEFGFSSYQSNISRSASRAYEEASDYARRFDEHARTGKGLILSGSVGCGKTHLAVAIMRHVLERFEAPSLFVTVPGLLEAERRSYDGDGATGSIETAKNAELLILDDLGAERGTEWTQEKLFYLINHRYAQGLPIVATTNFELQEAAQRIGPRSMSRLAERCTWLLVEGEDYRLRALRRV